MKPEKYLVPVSLSMVEAAHAGIRGEYQRPSRENTRSKWILILGLLKRNWRNPGIR